jgi:hypothetical protein
MRFEHEQGRYMMHCHNLVHEDHDMMAQFLVGADSPACDPITADRATRKPARPLSNRHDDPDDEPSGGGGSGGADNSGHGSGGEGGGGGGGEDARPAGNSGSTKGKASSITKCAPKKQTIAKKPKRRVVKKKNAAKAKPAAVKGRTKVTKCVTPATRKTVPKRKAKRKLR